MEQPAYGQVYTANELRKRGLVLTKAQVTVTERKRGKEIAADNIDPALPGCLYSEEPMAATCECGEALLRPA